MLEWLRFWWWQPFYIDGCRVPDGYSIRWLNPLFDVMMWIAMICIVIFCINGYDRTRDVWINRACFVFVVIIALVVVIHECLVPAGNSRDVPIFGK